MTIDYIGTALSLGGCTLVILPLIWVWVDFTCFQIFLNTYLCQGGITFPWSSAIVVGTLVGGIVLVSIFCIWEWKGAKLPIVPSTS